MEPDVKKVTSAPGNWLPALQGELRDATRELHHRLDHNPLLAPLVRPGVSMADYGTALQALYAINAPTELCIADYIQAQGLAFDYQTHRRMPDLLSDLEFFALPVPPQGWSGPLIDSPGALVGCLYVLEGSTLGGRVIFRQLQSALQISDQAGGKFFAGHGEQTMRMWQSFWDFAADICPEAQLASARQAAAGLFESILSLLEKQRS